MRDAAETLFGAKPPSDLVSPVKGMPWKYGTHTGKSPQTEWPRRYRNVEKCHTLIGVIAVGLRHGPSKSKSEELI